MEPECGDRGLRYAVATCAAEAWGASSLPAEVRPSFCRVDVERLTGNPGLHLIVELTEILTGSIGSLITILLLPVPGLPPRPGARL